MSSPFMEQSGFRGRADDGSETGASWLDDINTNWSQVPDTNFRVRFLIVNSGTKSLTDDYQLQYQRKPLGGSFGGWVNVNTASDSVVVVRSQGSTHFTSGSDCTQQIGIGIFLSDNNGMEDVDAITDATNTCGANTEFECEFCIEIVGADVGGGDEIQLRVVRNPSTLLDAYNQIPTITVDEPIALTATITDTDTLTSALSQESALTLTITDTDSLSADITLIAGALALSSTILDTDTLSPALSQSSALTLTLLDTDSLTPSLSQTSSLVSTLLDTDTLSPLTLSQLSSLVSTLLDVDLLTPLPLSQNSALTTLLLDTDLLSSDLTFPPTGTLALAATILDTDTLLPSLSGTTVVFRHGHIITASWHAFPRRGVIVPYPIPRQHPAFPDSP